MSSTAVVARRSRLDQITIRSASGRFAVSLQVPSTAVGLTGAVAVEEAFGSCVGGRTTIGWAIFPTGADAATWGTPGNAIAGGGGGGGGAGLAKRRRASSSAGFSSSPPVLAFCATGPASIG